MSQRKIKNEINEIKKRLDVIRMVHCDNCECSTPYKVPQVETAAPELLQALMQIKEVAEKRMKSGVAYTSGSFAGDNEVYFRLADEAIKKAEGAA